MHPGTATCLFKFTGILNSTYMLVHCASFSLKLSVIVIIYDRAYRHVLSRVTSYNRPRNDRPRHVRFEGGTFISTA